MEKLYDRCLRCNRKLKNDEARKLGYGKICYEKMTDLKVINLLDGSYTVETRKKINKGTESNSVG